MGLVRYLRKTPAKQVYADWKELCNHKKMLGNLIRQKNESWKKISQKYPCENEKNVCIVYDAPVLIVCGKTLRGTKYCRFFAAKQCKEICPLVQKHDMYWELKYLCAEATVKKENFWAQKFQNVK